jgi:hypothetical protein
MGGKPKRAPETTLVAQRHGKPYLIQWERTLRWQRRSVEVVARGDTQEVFDFLFVLFTSVLQMRDWIARSRPELEDDIEALFRDSSYLPLVRDIANGSKHMVLTRASVDGAATIAREYAGNNQSRFVIPRPGGGNREALPFAHAAIAEIEGFMQAHELI